MDDDAFIPCPYLATPVVRTAERERHIRAAHPDLLPAHRARMIAPVSNPDRVGRSARMRNARVFSRWYDDDRGGKHVVVVVLGEPARAGVRHWIVTAYLARRLTQGAIEWERG